ncbi:GCN5-related N-acetyltransferase [Beggiatoa sp. PS]|nr:GCN5-related N-acetyltransferase [Beggiatoa sp. PS]
MDITLKFTNWQDDIEALKTIREIVFIKELGIPAPLEWDEHDAKAIHLLALNSEDRPIGTGRLLQNGQIGRIAVKKEFRHQGIGTALLDALVNQASIKGFQSVFLYAQLQAVSLYQRRGFTAVGKVFEKASIPHQKMQYHC